AMADFAAAVKLRPRHADGHLYQGCIHMARSEFPAAVRAFTEASKYEQPPISSLRNRAYAYDKQGKSDEALADLNAAIYLVPDDARSYDARGTVYGNLGKYERALADFNKAIQLSPDFAGALLNRGHTYLQLGDTTRAQDDYTRSLRLDPS